ncbi:MAG: tRNA uridine-5-carboxymethylaminomethyl(34) synthesis GTPase MnmE [Muribaculaceae bacterium]|nr:tRNA uridine-5-carboxymethylaminomethyl(34) synthesis GTPase MnmE [Muribaculaceae bacterium]
MEQTLNPIYDQDTIVAVSTPPGVGGIAVVRLSGADALTVLGKCWKGAGVNKMVTHTAHLGKLIDSAGNVVDEVVITYFKGPKSFTGEDVVEISCHGSRWIQREIVNLLIKSGARSAEPGEFTKRAFLNGRLDLAQAEGVIDLISSSSRAAHRMAMQQASGRFTGYLNGLRDMLIDLASLLELELDFSEEEVEFADRKKLADLADEILATLRGLARSYATGKVLKEGIPVVIAGAPNAGKSTLLNALLDDDKAIVSDIPGTTRDVIEDTAEIDGVLFRFADTAGLRAATDEIEQIGIRKAEERLAKASIVLWLIDVTDQEAFNRLSEIKARVADLPEAKHILLLNKTDKIAGEVTLAHGLRDFASVLGISASAGKGMKEETDDKADFASVLGISASAGKGIDELKRVMVEIGYGDYNPESDIMLTNGRHYAAILRGIES